MIVTSMAMIPLVATVPRAGACVVAVHPFLSARNNNSTALYAGEQMFADIGCDGGLMVF